MNLRNTRFETDRDDIKSQTGYVFVLNGGAVDWKSSKKSTTAMSATEAEYIAASEAATEAVWIRKFISGLGIVPTINEPIKMFCDNSAALLIANDSGVQKGARHYHRRYHYVRECIELGKINLLKVYTDDNLADPFTKALPKGKLTQHARSIGHRLASSFMYICVLAIHGANGKIDEISGKGANSCWINIIKEVRRLEEKGINLLLFMKKKLGNGLSTLFWDDVWCDGGKLKNRFPRAYALENSKQITVGQKLAHPSLYHSFRRHPRGGLELTQVEELAKVINPVVLTQSPDSWSWTLNNSGGYTVASSRNMIDSRLLPKGDLKTRWIRYVPNKVNTFAWKVMTNSLPTRFNISRRGIDIESLSCVNCDVGIETNDHLFFACNTAKKISKLINRWWDVPFMDINSYGEWRSWIDNVKLPKKNKSMFQGIYFVMWWLLWNFRNKKMFEAKPKSKETFFDEIICTYYWCRYRCNTLFSWDDWYKNPSLISL
ncbi:RNA-directed DNA polymerase, eukaryota, reverse transcriptase zinc-binding domain protein [Tanacetum coccineum]